MRSATAALIASLIASTAGGQWLNHPTPGIPRTADGHGAVTHFLMLTVEGEDRAVRKR